MKATYKFENKKKFQVTYGFANGKWSFRIGTFTLLTKCPGGKKTADHIAELLRGSWLRCGKIDGTCRSAINRALQVRTLANYRPELNWT